jgi:hypothetical protein
MARLALDHAEFPGNPARGIPAFPVTDCDRDINVRYRNREGVNGF